MSCLGVLMKVVMEVAIKMSKLKKLTSAPGSGRKMRGHVLPTGQQVDDAGPATHFSAGPYLELVRDVPTR